MFRRMLKAILGPSSAETESARLTAGGFEALADDVVVQTVRWSEVTSILATWCVTRGREHIELLFFLEGAARRVRVSETADGWSDVEAAMLRAVPAISRDWRYDVKPPPRIPAVPVTTILYER